MRTVLAPIDFSEASDRSLNYSVELAKKSGALIQLLYVYDYPIIARDPVAWIPSTNELVEEFLNRLRSIRAKIQTKYGNNLHVQCYCEIGTVLETIHTFATRHNVDLIIMGMQGGGFVSEKIIGSNTSSLMRRSPCPVLGIPKKSSFNSIRRIVLATDYEDADYQSILQPLKEFIRIFDAHLFVLNVVSPDDDVKVMTLSETRIGKALAEIPYTALSTVHSDIAAAVDEFIEDEEMDLAVIIPRRHSFFYSLFHEAQTKKLAFHTTVPLLALHE